MGLGIFFFYLFFTSKYESQVACTRVGGCRLALPPVTSRISFLFFSFLGPDSLFCLRRATRSNNERRIGMRAPDFRRPAHFSIFFRLLLTFIILIQV